mmetsp:Transcript_162256/g.296193  ORF Transcript_162256/g.296193 Transcript_162256/m.296193 type:complete len:365 (-) Transcript_162256:42-1136(-)
MSFLVLSICCSALAFSPTSAVHPGLRGSPLQADSNRTMPLKRLQLKFPKVNRDKFSSGSLPVYVTSEEDDKECWLVKRDYMHNFTQREVDELKILKQNGSASTRRTCTPWNTIFDLGFYDGADSRAYLNAGYCVVGVEADPDLVALALQNFAVHVASGQLRVANAAIAPEGQIGDWTVFYRSRCTKEWNSFLSTVGCRSCTPPHKVDSNACEQVHVQSMDCSQIFTTFGVPLYLKLDIEGAETGCFQAMQRFAAGTQLPTYISAEITELKYIDALHNLGYQGFKLVRQDRLVSNGSSSSGPWGEHASDCAYGPSWRDYYAIRQEFAGMLSRSFNANDACPGGIVPINDPGAGSIWYDIHARLSV